MQPIPLTHLPLRGARADSVPNAPILPRAREPNVIEVTVGSTGKLFHELDPSPLAGRALDEQFERYVLASARELHASTYDLSLHVPIEEMPAKKEALALAAAIRCHFSARGEEEARRLQSLMREGRQALVIGFLFLFVCGALGWFALHRLSAPLGDFLDEGLLIIGWVALWRPVEILLYDWRPIRRKRRIFEQLARMSIEFRPLGRV